MNHLPSPDETRIDGVASHPIRLADGLHWGFAKPVMRFVPMIISKTDGFGRTTESIDVRVTIGYPLEIEGLRESLRGACDGESSIQQYRAFFSLAIALLRRAHDIDRSTACSLLSVAEPELTRLVEDVLLLLTDSIENWRFSDVGVS
jgi:hypothetical protein